MDYGATTAHRFNTDKLVIDIANSRVGMGTATPRANLEVFGGDAGGSPYIGALLLAAPQDGYSASLSIETKTGTDRIWTFLPGTGGGSPNTNLRIWDSTAAAERFTILGDGTGAGNVGIGITTPSDYADLTLGGGVLCLAEAATPTADANFAKIYSKNDNKFYFQDGAGSEHKVLHAGDVDISDDTNLAVTSPIVLTDDTLSLNQSAVDHGSIGGLTGDDHSQYLLATGARAGASSQAQDFGSNGIKADVIAESTAATGVTIDGFLIKDSGPAGWDGWQIADETWTYASADDPTFTFTISGDKTGKYSVGMRLKLTQTTAKYFIITAVSYSSPNTTVTIYGGTDYDLANAAIASPYYSTQKAPLSFPLDPDKWTVETADTNDVTQASPTSGTWYNLGSITISVPIGAWNVSYQVAASVYKAAATSVSIYTTLSTANNTESDRELTHFGYQYFSTTQDTYLGVPMTRFKSILLASKTSYYLNAKTDITGIDQLRFWGHISTSVIRVVCAYL